MAAPNMLAYVTVNTFDYFRNVLTRIAGLPFSRTDELLPDRWQASRQATAATA